MSNRASPLGQCLCNLGRLLINLLFLIIIIKKNFTFSAHERECIKKNNCYSNASATALSGFFNGHTMYLQKNCNLERLINIECTTRLQHIFTRTWTTTKQLRLSAFSKSSQYIQSKNIYSTGIGT